MKKVLLTVFALTAAASVFAQGTVIFNNRVGATTHVWGPQAGNVSQSLTGNASIDNPGGTTVYTGTLLSGANYSASLLAAPGANVALSSLVPSSTTTTFRTGTGAGNIVGVTASLNGVAPDAAMATIAMVAWDNTSGLYSTWTQAKTAWDAGLIAAGVSTPFNVALIGGQANQAPALTGLTSFNIYYSVPEPSTMALAGLGAAALLIFRRRK